MVTSKRGTSEIASAFHTKLIELCDLMNEALDNDIKIEFQFVSDPQGRTNVGKFEVWAKYKLGN